MLSGQVFIFHGSFFFLSFQRHEEEFNELVSSYYDLKEVEEIILQLFQKVKTPQTSMESCIKVIGNHCSKYSHNLFWPNSAFLTFSGLET